MLAVGLLGYEMADLPAGLLCLLEIRDSIELEAQVFLRWEGKFAALGSFGGRKAEEPSLMYGCCSRRYGFFCVNPRAFGVLFGLLNMPVHMCLPACLSRWLPLVQLGWGISSCAFSLWLMSAEDERGVSWHESWCRTERNDYCWEKNFWKSRFF